MNQRICKCGHSETDHYGSGSYSCAFCVCNKFGVPSSREKSAPHAFIDDPDSNSCGACYLAKTDVIHSFSALKEHNALLIEAVEAARNVLGDYKYSHDGEITNNDVIEVINKLKAALKASRV